MPLDCCVLYSTSSSVLEDVNWIVGLVWAKKSNAPSAVVAPVYSNGSAWVYG